MGINLGAFISPLICGWLGQKVGWHWGFGAAGVGMTLGVVQYVLGEAAGGRGAPARAAQGRLHPLVRVAAVRGVGSLLWTIWTGAMRCWSAPWSSLPGS